MAGFLRGGCRRPCIPAAESTLGSHPSVALSSAQVFPEWINLNPAVHGFSANGDNPLNLSHSRGSLHGAPGIPGTHSPFLTWDRAALCELALQIKPALTYCT